MFENFNYLPLQVKRYFRAATNDLRLAKSTAEPELIFYACYNLIVKVAVAVCAKNNLRVKSRVGHHRELINKLAELLANQDIEIVADKMRVKRNRDLYDGGALVSKKEAAFYLSFCANLIMKADSYLFPNKLL